MQEDEEDEDGRGGFTVHRYNPLPAHRAVYDASYSIYRSLHPALAPAFKALAELTGSMPDSESAFELEPEPEAEAEVAAQAASEIQVESKVEPEPEPEVQTASGQASGISTI